jgi:3-hydroxy acid dehydrogenase/malonic semialdehyde reductase
MTSLQGKTICVTGATSGFGRAIAEQLAAEGARLIILGRRAERLAEVTQSLQGKTSIHSAVLDVRDRAAVKSFFEQLPAEFANIDALVNNAGLALGTTPAPNVDMDQWEQMIDTNIKGLLYCTQSVLPGMVARDTGHIVNIGSIAGSYAYPGGNVYGGTKAFVAQFSANLRADLLGKHIRVSNIEPGMAETEFSIVRYSGDEAKAKSVYQGVAPLSADDIASTVLWVLKQPAHVNINRVEVMPVMQASAGLAVSRII